MSNNYRRGKDGKDDLDAWMDSLPDDKPDILEAMIDMLSQSANLRRMEKNTETYEKAKAAAVTINRIVRDEDEYAETSIGLESAMLPDLVLQLKFDVIEVSSFNVKEFCEALETADSFVLTACDNLCVSLRVTFCDVWIPAADPDGSES